MYPHARLLALLMLMISNTLTAARPVWMEVPQDLNHDGKNDWNDVTVSVSPTHEKGPKHPWPFYTLEIHMEDNKRIMDQSSSLHSACHHIGADRVVSSLAFEDGLVEKHVYLYRDTDCKQMTDKLTNGIWRFEGLDRKIGSWKVD